MYRTLIQVILCTSRSTVRSLRIHCIHHVASPTITSRLQVGERTQPKVFAELVFSFRSGFNCSFFLARNTRMGNPQRTDKWRACEW
jgi:hypothetical protein